MRTWQAWVVFMPGIYASTSGFSVSLPRCRPRHLVPRHPGRIQPWSLGSKTDMHQQLTRHLTPCRALGLGTRVPHVGSVAMRCDAIRCDAVMRSGAKRAFPSPVSFRLGCPFARTNCFPLQIATAPHWLRLARRTNEVDDILRPDFVYGASACISLQRATQFCRTLPTDLTASHRLPVQNQLGTFAWASAHAALHTLMGRLPNRHRRLRVSDSIIRGRIPEV